MKPLLTLCTTGLKFLIIPEQKKEGGVNGHAIAELPLQSLGENLEDATLEAVGSYFWQSDTTLNLILSSQTSSYTKVWLMFTNLYELNFEAVISQCTQSDVMCIVFLHIILCLIPLMIIFSLILLHWHLHISLVSYFLFFL